MIDVADVKTLNYCVDGNWSESTTDKYMDVSDSSTGEVFAQAPCCTAAEVEAAILSDRALDPEAKGLLIDLLGRLRGRKESRR